MMRDLFQGKNRRALGAAAVTAAFLVPLGVFGAPALARSAASAAQYQYGPSQYQYKITVCHHTHSAKHPWVKISVSVNAWKGHSRHAGDFIVTGTAVCPPLTATTAPTTHGKSGTHGNNGNGNNGKGHGK